MHLYKTNTIVKKLFPNFVWSVPTSDNDIYLTFDDGPIPGVTEFVLEQLEEYNAKATFFAVGENISKHPQIFDKILAGGHAVGNHTFNHLNGWKTNSEAYLDNVQKCANVISDQLASIDCHTTTKLFRPPYGKIKSEQVKQIRQKYQIIMWDVLTGDYDKNISPEVCLKKTIQHTEQGSVVIFHDSIKAERNMSYVLPRFLDHFSQLGYSFKLFN